MRILIVEDEADLASALRGALEEEGYACDVALDGRRALFLVGSWEYDLLLLDLMLPGIGGREILRRLRENKTTPVLVLTARDAVSDKVDLLDAGADDYLTKPFELEELIARVRALIRRSAHEPVPTLEIGDVQVDTVARVLTRDGRPIAVSPKEYALVEYLALHRGEIVTRTQIYEHIYDEHEDTSSNVVEVYVSNLRRKLGRGLIRTCRGQGYVVDV